MKFDNEQEKRLIEILSYNFGKQICELLTDNTVVEIMLNPDGALWVERLGCPKQKIGSLSAVKAEQAIRVVATALGTEVTRTTPILECELPIGGSRFEAVIPPIVTQPTFTIRKKAISIFSLEEYVFNGIMTTHQKASIEQAVDEHKNILVVGGTGTGKTTLTNAILQSMTQNFPTERFVIIEDTAELQCEAPNTVTLRSNEHIDMTRLLKVTMRLAPDRIIVGEVRDGAALALLKSWNTGHPGGIATVHANNALSGLSRIEQLIAEASSSAMQSFIADAIDVVVCIEKTKTSRTIKEIIEVLGYDHATNQYKANRLI